MTESPQHIKGKNRLASIMRVQPNIRNVQVEYKTGVFVPTTLGPREYIADVYCEQVISPPPYDKKYPSLLLKRILEVDGPKGHDGIIAHRKNLYRDALLKQHGFTTTRYQTRWLVGRKKITDEQILLELFHSQRKGSGVE